MQTIPNSPSGGPPVDIEAELDRLALRYRRAGGMGIEILNMIGGQAEGLLERLPLQVRQGLEGATEHALRQAVKAAHGSRRFSAPGNGQSSSRMLATALGAAGGLGGAGSTLAELPVTTTVLLRAILDTAEREGFDPASEAVQFDCIRVFAASGPLEHDDGADLGFVGTRLTLTGATMNALIARVAPRLSVVLGQKLAAQAVPLLGAVAGAATNYAYTGYYQEIAAIQFGLRRLALEADVPHDQLLGDLRARLSSRG